MPLVTLTVRRPKSSAFKSTVLDAVHAALVGAGVPALDPAESAHGIVARLTEPILDDLPFASGDRVLAFVNGMGGTPLIELYLVYEELRALLEARGITIARNLVGPYITSLEMAGTSITLLRLDDELIRLWDAPVVTAGLRWGA